MNLIKAIENSYKTAEKRHWDTIYWCVDIHETIIKSNYENNDSEFFPFSIETLKILSEQKHIKLILYTCSYLENSTSFKNNLNEKYNIHFDFINENPDVENTKYGDYSKKPYYNVILDDKGGFEPEKDWEEIHNYLKENIDKLKEKLTLN